jgi:thiamine biosynthesis protein ThiI
MHGLMLISGGIDSPVAAALMLQQNVRLSALFFDAWPFSDKEQLDKVNSLVEHLRTKYNSEIPLYRVPHAKNLTEIGRACSRKIGCVLCRRMMLRIAGELARSNDMDFLVTGESLGQVASQTLRNLRAENPASKLFIIRPLIGLDKIEIENRAKNLGTYDISIEPGMCCTMAPKYPVTYAENSRVIDEETHLNLLELVENALNNAKIT